MPSSEPTNPSQPAQRTQETPQTQATGESQVATGESQLADITLTTPATPSEKVQAYDSYPPPKKGNSKTKWIVGALLIPLAAGAIYMALKSDNAAPPVVTSPADTTQVAAAITPVDSLSTATPESAVVAAPGVIDSAAIKDSIKKRRAQRDSIRKANAARDSALLKLAQPSGGPTLMGKARNAASAMLSNAGAAKKFNDGATHKGGVLGTRTKGDLQTQIDALAPYLSQAGITYEQFKSLVKESGVSLFDEFGRMVPGAMQRFASGG
jgi:hypothetical protein